MLLLEYLTKKEEGTLPASYKNRKVTEFKCENCGQDAVKTTSEYNRNVNSGKKNFCCQSCATIYNNKHRDYEVSDKLLEHLKTIRPNKRDEFTPFRYTMKCVKQRTKEYNIDLQYLKDLWESQQRICPYTNLQLVLPEEDYTKDQDITTRASLDRIDSNKGYVRGNVQFVSTPINYMKNTMSDRQTKEFLKRISSFTSTFVEDWTISSPQEVSGAQAGN